MPNIQQPEMRRSGNDPLVQDSAENKATSAPVSGGEGRPDAEGRPIAPPPQPPAAGRS